jgi:signal transduction histidine kinase
VALLGGLAVFAVARASHDALLRGRALAAVVVLGIVLLAVIAIALVWSARLAQAARNLAAGSAGLAQPPEAARPESAETTEVFVRLSYRVQSLVHRQIALLDGLENEVEDPELLKVVFGIDHLATRMRRDAENLAVLGGAVPRRQWTKPVSVTDVLRSAVSETLDYARVQVISSPAVALNGYALADTVHLLAELVENATGFSPHESKVVVRTQTVAAGLAIEIDDRGLGLAPQEYAELNALLREPTAVSVRQLLQDSRIGLYVVAQLAHRHGIAVQLQPNITGGTQALVVLPKALLADSSRGSVTTGAQAAETESGLSSGPGVWRPSEAEAADGSEHSSATTAAARPTSVPVGTLPAPRPAPDGQSAAVSAFARSAPPSTPALPTRAGETGHRGSGQRPDASAVDSSPLTQASALQADTELPPLPRRQPRQNLAPQLVEPPSATTAASRVSNSGPTPGLMADFRLGMARGRDQQTPTAQFDEHTPTQEGR